MKKNTTRNARITDDIHGKDETATVQQWQVVD
jgi:hypothetical protein